MLALYYISNWRENKMRERLCKKIHRCPKYRNIPNYVRKDNPVMINKYYNADKDFRPGNNGLDYILR